MYYLLLLYDKLLNCGKLIIILWKTDTHANKQPTITKRGETKTPQ